MTVQQIINIARISQFLAAKDVAQGSLWGKRIAPDTPRVLYMERKAVEWMLGIDGAVSAVSATGSIEMTFIGFRGDKMEIVVNGSSLGIFERGVGDTDLDILAASIASFFDGVNDFVFSSASEVVNLTAPASLGATVNGKLVVNYTLTTTYPYVIFNNISSITSSSALANGTGTVQGAVVSFDDIGFCISTSPNPTISDTVFSGGSGSGVLSLPLTGLASGTLYYIRMYGTYNTTTTIYSEQSSFTTL